MRLLGERFREVLLSDFYPAYNLIPGRHQRCWTHLLRDLHELKENHAARDDVSELTQQVRQLCDVATAWLLVHPLPAIEERRQQYHDLYQQAWQLGQQHTFAGQHPRWALAKRLLRHQDGGVPVRVEAACAGH